MDFLPWAMDRDFETTVFSRRVLLRVAVSFAGWKGSSCGKKISKENYLVKKILKGSFLLETRVLKDSASE